MKTEARKFRLTEAGKPKAVYPQIGVVTPVRNRKNWTLGFVERFARQDYPIFTHYIVDSASTDGTPEAITALPLRSVRLLRAGESAYWTAATNVGVRQALKDCCDFILTINDDAIVADDFLTRLVKATLAHDVKLVGSLIAYADQPNVIWGVGAFNDFESGRFVQTGFGNMTEDAFRREVPANAELVGVQCLCGNGTLVHRAVFDATGLYDERNTPHYHADTELTMRAAKANIQSWVAPEARVYNRFTDDQDGPFSKKNLRFFSLRSANFVRPIVHILRQNCRLEFRPRAFLSYFGPYLPMSSMRQRSMLLRMAGLLAEPNWGGIRAKQLVPSLSQAENLRFDMELLRQLPEFALVDAAFAYFLQRLPSDAERKALIQQMRRNRSIDRVLLDVLKKSGLAARQPEQANFIRLLLDPARITDDVLQSSEWSKDERRVLAQVHDSRSIADSLKSTLLKTRDLPKKLFGKIARSAGKNNASQEQAPLLPIAAQPSDDRVLYFNIDVMCMAQLDPQAATGVYRYASSIFEEIAKRENIELRTFFSPQLADGYRLWLKSNPGHRRLAFDDTKKISEKGVVFYPYFPAQECHPGLAALPTALTICDLFPLVNPEWFSSVAVENFRRQLHVLPSVEHFFCISRATEIQLRQTFPSLRGTSSVAHLAASRPAALPSRDIQQRPARYFACVGTIEPRKNLKTVIEAFGQLRGEGIDDLHMLVAGQEGWSISRDQLQSMAGDKFTRVRFLGRLSDPDLHALYRDAEFMVFTSLAEGFGLPILESCLHGTPVITSNNSSMCEIAGDAALLVDPRNRNEIAAAIRTFATDPEKRALFSARACERLSHFSWVQCADVHIDQFQKMWARPQH